MVGFCFFKRLFVTFSPRHFGKVMEKVTAEKSAVCHSCFLESHSSRCFRHSSNDLAKVENSSPSV